MLKLYKAKVFASYQPHSAGRDATDEETIKFPKESQYFDEIMEPQLPGAVLSQAAVLDARVELHLPDAPYDAQGRYRHNGRRERYVCIDGEGEVTKLVFAERNFAVLKRNYAFTTNEDPYFPCTRLIKLPALTGTETHFVSPALWSFVLKEFELKQWQRTVRGEERSNGYKRGAHREWETEDFLSERPNKQRPPPKAEGYKPPVGSK